ncbi:MAG TPA: DNA/RNA non-specific endonuclease [Thermoanaerobaculia bacterium]|nr:DNA/RNA non-specific endonuclease [Thermoanaerobaculia bacterium]
MNLRRTFVLLLLCFAFVIPAQAASPNVVISQVYGGGGSGVAGTAYTLDYVELHNTSGSPVPIGGWSIQYGSSTGQFGSSAGNIFAFPAGTTLGAGQYLTVKTGNPAGAAGATFTSDFTTTGLTMAAGSGKVALVTSSGALNCGATATPCATNDPRILDKVAYGSSNNAETTPVNNGTALNSTNGAVRKNSGCLDTDNNFSDFVVATVAGGLVPRTMGSGAVACDVVADLPPSINAPANPITTVNQDAAPFTVGLTGNDDGGIYNWSATAGTGVSAVNVTGGQGSANATFTVTLAAGFSGTASFTASLSDGVNAPATRTVNIGVTPTSTNDAPVITPFANPIATKAQDAAAFTFSVSGSDDDDVYAWGATAGTGISAVVVTAGQGTANATYTITLQAGFSGTAAFTVSLTDGVNAAVTHPVTITVTPAPPPPLDHVVISQVYGGGGNGGAAFQNDFVELYNPDDVAHDLSGWTIQYGAATGTTWQVQPLGGTIEPGEYYLIKLATNGIIGSVVPDANINGTLNLSGTNGKVALVSNGDPLSGCVVASPVVDLVGYGSTANCREGATNAPTLSNATAGFRKNGGFTDTNVNGADFITGTPFPRRTSPIVELPPTVLSSDPRNNGSNAPRDASITINFTEPVDVQDGWFSISCVTTGLHDSATVANGGANAWIIIPNVNFLPGEQCTVTVLKAFVHDSDLDDSGPNSDQLTGNYSATFTIATGAAPSYGPEVHTTFGFPAFAETSLDSPNAYLMAKPEFTLSYNRDLGIPNWVSWHLADEWIGSLERFDTFRADPAVPAEWFRVNHTSYSGTGFDRGHMVPNADRDPETSSPINQATFLMTNMIPQAPDNNQGPWANMENYLRTLLPANEVYIVAGGWGVGGNNGSGVVNTIAGGNVTVPAMTWKVALVLPKQSGDDVSRVTAATRTIAVIMPNVQGIRTVDWMTYLTSVDAVEALTGYDFFAEVADAVENAIEAGVNGSNPPGVDDQSISLNEDGSQSFTLEAAAANDNTLTYTIVTQPTNGTLSGSGANQTYTPAPDFNGSDSFTFRVSQGSSQSNTSTMTVTVLEVNDAPNATADARGTNEDTALSFAAAELTANDNAGPANESDQTLTVTAVSGATNGSVALDAGTVTFTPAVNYNGAASFTYEVCDNGVTGGLTTSQCATSTVAVTIAAVNDAPTASLDAPSSSVEGSAVAATVTADDLDADALTISWTVAKNGAPFANGTGNAVSFTPDDNGSYVISAAVTDGTATANASATVAVTNAGPTIAGITGPSGSQSIGTAVSVTVNATDAGTADTHTATFTWGDSTSTTVNCVAGTCSTSHTYATAGIYTVAIVVTDDDGASATSTLGNVVITDANAGFITGGGWISTPSGKANLNVNAKYQKNGTATGSTSFTVSGSSFASTSYDWLVISGTTATLQGSGTINGTGNYGFTVTATDAGNDTFAIRVFDKTTNATVYEAAGTLGGGNLTIH